jgi:hypothetical protein
MNELSLCDECGKELYTKLKDSVAAQHMHYEVMPLDVQRKTEARLKEKNT